MLNDGELWIPESRSNRPAESVVFKDFLLATRLHYSALQVGLND